MYLLALNFLPNVDREIDRCVDSRRKLLGVPMRPPLCTGADDVLRYSATVGN